MKREPGFYHLKLGGKWIVAQWAKGPFNDKYFWYICGDHDSFESTDFEQINETHIPSPDEVKQ